MKDFECSGCGKPLLRGSPDQPYCGPCRQKKRNENPFRTTCMRCGGQAESRDGTPHMYCDSCLAEMRRKSPARQYADIVSDNRDHKKRPPRSYG